LTSHLSFEGIGGLLTRYRIIGGGLSANIVAQYQSWNSMYEKVAERHPEFINQHGDEARAYQLRYLARRSVQLGDGAFAMVLIKESLRISNKPLLNEPVKTMLTFCAALMSRYLPQAFVSQIAQSWTGAKVVA